MAFAIIVVECFLDKILLGMGRVFKRVVSAAKATRVGRALGRGAGVVRKGLRPAGRVVKQGIAGIKNSKLVVRLRGVIGKGSQKLSELRDNILERFGFRRIWLEKHGTWIELWGEFNAKLLLVRERADGEGNKTLSHELVGDGSVAGKTANARTPQDQSFIGSRPQGTRKQVVVSDEYNRRLNELAATDPDAYQELLEELSHALKSGMSKEQIRKLVEARADPIPAFAKGDEFLEGLFKDRSRITRSYGGTIATGEEIHHKIAMESLSHPVTQSGVRGGFDINNAEKRGLSGQP